MKYWIVLALALLLSGCRTPEERKVFAEEYIQKYQTWRCCIVVDSKSGWGAETVVRMLDNDEMHRLNNNWGVRGDTLTVKLESSSLQRREQVKFGCRAKELNK